MTLASVRRGAVVRLGTLAALLLLAGSLPWITAGPMPIRLIALPLLFAGTLMVVATTRVRTASFPRPAKADASRLAACPGCSCGETTACTEQSAGRAPDAGTDGLMSSPSERT